MVDQVAAKGGATCEGYLFKGSLLCYYEYHAYLYAEMSTYK